jgi:hypothetical protein
MRNSVTMPVPENRVKALRIAVALAALLILATAGWLIYRQLNAQAEGPYVLPRSAAIEDKYGVRFTFLALTGRDGLIDVRYRIVDAGKAKNFGHYTETSPMLIAEDSGERVEVTRMGLHNHRVEPGLIFHILFRNTANAIKQGELVTIQVGDLKLEHVRVQ